MLPSDHSHRLHSSKGMWTKRLSELKTFYPLIKWLNMGARILPIGHTRTCTRTYIHILPILPLNFGGKDL